MRHRILVALAAAITLAPYARATQIDDFTFNFPSHTIPNSPYPSPALQFTFSLPASPTPTPFMPNPFETPIFSPANSFLIVDPTLPPPLNTEDLFFSTTGDIGYAPPDGVYEIRAYKYFHSLTGQPVFTGSVTDPTFVPGTYSYDWLYYLGPVPGTVTITPETASTPEPTTLALLATGSLGLLTRFHRRRSPVA